MNHEKAIRKQRINRRFRVRKRLKGTPERPRLNVTRSVSHMYCQVIDDSSGKTLASASTTEKELASQLKSTSNCDAAKLIGQTIAERAKAAGVNSVCFDRGRFSYHGRVAALADAARENGISF